MNFAILTSLVSYNESHFKTEKAKCINDYKGDNPTYLALKLSTEIDYLVFLVRWLIQSNMSNNGALKKKLIDKCQYQ